MIGKSGKKIVTGSSHYLHKQKEKEKENSRSSSFCRLKHCQYTFF